VIGYQGTWSGKPLWGKWIHVHFGVVRADSQGTFPEEATSDQFLDPAPYLGIILDDRNENAQLLKCN
jgi:hypothetical protein